MSAPLVRRGRVAILFVLFLIVTAAPVLAPRPPDLQEDPAGARYLPPLTRAHALRVEAHRLHIVTRLQATADGWEFERAGKPEALPRAALAGAPEPRFYLLGTDALGRDLLSRVLFGARHSLGIAALSVALALVLGIGVGSLAGYAGGAWDAGLMRGVDALMSIPRVLIYLLCAALFPPSSLLLVLVLGGTTWTGLARVVRAGMMSIVKSDLALQARALGSRPLRVVLLHLLPQLGPILVTTASLRFADTLLLESALSLLGLGPPPPAVSLGGIMGSGRDVLAEAWWVVAWPGIAIAAAVAGLRAAAADLFRLADPPSLF
jgi:peptide/nickel transport system permease protein